MLNSQRILTGKTMHWRRSQEANHRFVYPVLYFSVPITGKIISKKLFKHNKFGLYAFYDKDHGSKRNSANKSSKQHQNLKHWFDELIEQSEQKQQLQQNIKHIELITQPRVLGFVFNPVSFWFCYDNTEQLIAVLAEVNNTFGSRFSYLLTLDDGGQITHSESLSASKRLYVSPFFEVTGCYEFKFDVKKLNKTNSKKTNPTKTNIVINYHRDLTSAELDALSAHEKKHLTPTLATTLSLTHQEFTDKNLMKSFTKYGLSTLAVVARIHWQAVKLKVKGAQFFSSKQHIFNNGNLKNLAKNSQEMHHESSAGH